MSYPSHDEAEQADNCGCEQRGGREFLCAYHEGFADGRDASKLVSDGGLVVNGLTALGARHLATTAMHRLLSENEANLLAVWVEIANAVILSGSQLVDDVVPDNKPVRCRRCGGHGKVSVPGSAVHANRCGRCHGSKVDPEPGGTSRSVVMFPSVDRDTPTLGDVKDSLNKLLGAGVTIESIGYVLARLRDGDG